MAKTGIGALAVTPAGVMTARPAAPAGRAERNGGLKVYYIVDRKVKEKIERGELKFGTEYDALRALVISDIMLMEREEIERLVKKATRKAE
jgi:hypothetical protein